MSVQVLMAHKEFTGTWSGNGWRATLKDWPKDVSPGVLSIAIYDSNWNYLYTPGAFQYDGSWYLETPPGQLTQEFLPIYWGVLESSLDIGRSVLPTTEDSVVLTIQPSTDPRYDKLNKELTDDPKALGYASMSNEEAAAEINKVQFTEATGFQIELANQYLVVNGKMKAIEDSAAISAVDWMLITRYFGETRGDIGRIFSDVAAVSFLNSTIDGLVTEGLISETDKDNLDAGSEVGISRGQEIEVGFVTATDVSYARGL